jgi:hypothetical protein
MGTFDYVMGTFEYFMIGWGKEIVTMIVCAVFGMIGVMIKNLLKTHLNDDTKRKVAKTVVLFVEQVYKDLHGEEKLNAALARASLILGEKGIDVSATEMKTLIEAAVAEFNEAFKK